MNLIELANNNISKKWGLALAGLYAISQAESTIQAWQITIVVCTAVVVQGLLDWKKPA